MGELEKGLFARKSGNKYFSQGLINEVIKINNSDAKTKENQERSVRNRQVQNNLRHQQIIYLSPWARKYIFNASYLISDHLNLITKKLLLIWRTDDVSFSNFVN